MLSEEEEEEDSYSEDQGTNGMDQRLEADRAEQIG